MKLENIIMMDATEASVPKLVDFGLAKMIGPGEVANECLGTVAYASPEQLKGVKYDKAVDVWSLGVIFYVLMSGTLPYEGPTQKDTAQMIVDEPLNYRSPKWKYLSKEAQNLATRMLQKDAKMRCSLDAVMASDWFKMAEKKNSRKMSF